MKIAPLVIIALMLGACSGTKVSIKEETQRVSVVIPEKEDSLQLVVSPFIVPLGLEPDLVPAEDVEVFTSRPDPSRPDETRVKLTVPKRSAERTRAARERIAEDLRTIDAAGGRLIVTIPERRADTTVALNRVTVTEEEPFIERFLGYIIAFVVLLTVAGVAIKKLKK